MREGGREGGEIEAERTKSDKVFMLFVRVCACHVYVCACTCVYACHVNDSLAATLLHHHVLVMSKHHTIVLVVQHGQRAQARGHTGGTRHPLGVVHPQQTLQENQRRSFDIVGDGVLLQRLAVR